MSKILTTTKKEVLKKVHVKKEKYINFLRRYLKNINVFHTHRFNISKENLRSHWTTSFRNILI